MTPTLMKITHVCGLLLLARVVLSAERQYYIAANVEDWNYAPSGRNLCADSGELVDDAATFLESGEGRIFAKTRFIEYTDDTFEVVAERPKEWEHLGLLGPLLRAEVDDAILITLKNNAPFPVGISPTGAYEVDGPNVKGIPTNTTAKYRWMVPAAAGPGPYDPSSKLWQYSSETEETHVYLGLVGPLLVTAKGQAKEDGSPQGVDREIITLFQVFNENDETVVTPEHSKATSSCVKVMAKDGSEYVSCDKRGDDQHVGDSDMSSLTLRSQASQNLTLEFFEETNLKHAINGYIFCNNPGLNMSVGESLVWHTMVIGNEVDIHTPHWHGLAFTHHGRRVDTVSLMPGSTASVYTVVDNPGTWMLHCHVNDHLVAGMVAVFHVSGAAPEFQLEGPQRHYFVAAEEIEWDYTPMGGDYCSGALEPFGEDALTFVEAGDSRIGSKYRKAVFIEYTDDTFTSVKERSASEEHLGLLGPILRGAVGDTLVVHFLNRLPNNAASMHPHGVWYSKSSEGTPYNDGTSGNDTLDDAVPPGKNHIYVWLVPQRAGPDALDGSSIGWMYHSHVSEVGDTYAGMVGAIVITGDSGDAGRPKDVDREFVLLFHVMNEMASVIWETNFESLQKESGVEALEGLEEDEDFGESNLMHAVNGYMYCNLPGLRASAGERVRMYVLGLGTEVDLHSPKVATTIFNLKDDSSEVIALLPGVLRTADVVAHRAGAWKVQCQVADHITAGMTALLMVDGNGDRGVVGDMEGVGGPVYYIAAEEIQWSYGSSGRNLCHGKHGDAGDAISMNLPITGRKLHAAAHDHVSDIDTGDEGDASATWLQPSNVAIGDEYTKAVFRQYSDATFTSRVPQPDMMGILGPLIRAHVGEVVTVVLRNSLSFDVNLELGALVPLFDGNYSAAVAPGKQETFQWFVPPTALGNATREIAFYTSTVDVVGHTNAGLVGIVVIQGPTASSDTDDIPEYPLLFMIQNENASPFLAQNLEAAGIQEPEAGSDEAAEFEESNLKHAINGFLFCNMPTINVTEGAIVRWLLLALGSETDMHTPVFEGQIIYDEGTSMSTVELMPAVSRVVDMMAVTPGTFEVHCLVEDHVHAGMMFTMAVEEA